MFNKFFYKKKDFKSNSFLIYGLGSSGKGVIKYLKKIKVKNYFLWDDNSEIRKKNLVNIKEDLKKIIRKVDYIILSPGVSFKKAKYKQDLIYFKKKIITDIDLLYLSNKKFNSIVVTGTNGKSTTSKMIYHLLKKNKFKVKLGGNIGTSILTLGVKNNDFIVIEASSFQLAYSKYIKPDYALILNITNDHLDWHGSKKNYVNSKFKIFKLQNKKNFAILNKKFIHFFKKRNYSSKLIIPRENEYKKVKFRIKNDYLRLNINYENMIFVFTLSKLLGINTKSFINTMSSFKGLSHRYEKFLEKDNITFINDSKATSLQSSKLALSNNKNIFWILGGLPKEKDKINLNYLKKNIIKSYIIGKNKKFFKKILKDKVNFTTSYNLKDSIIKAIKDIKIFKRSNNIILLSPGAASFDQFKNFEERGDTFKRLSKIYAKKLI
ncbi:MAG: UDP-N-acetylmuramoyl-L-alanine--D-glutamate ligase [Candidatus Pelagibacter sp. TMED273]|nr:MAG: UDP-N-acetylmuramoyl-L-alanine--D-glutamate ligase [Candidatus Pelagibacter sp. TMED273]